MEAIKKFSAIQEKHTDILKSIDNKLEKFIVIQEKIETSFASIAKSLEKISGGFALD